MKIIFTLHANQRIKRRKLLNEEVTDAIKNPDKIVKKQGKFYYRKKLNRGSIEVVVEKTENNLNIITVYWI